MIVTAQVTIRGPLIQVACLCFTLLAAQAALADRVENNDLIVTADACIGFDCVSAENLEGATLRLKENNTRVSFFNTGSADVLGKIWSLEANDSANGGPSEFRFKAQLLVVKLSDGQDQGYSCSLGETLTITVPNETLPPQEPIPLGEPVREWVETNRFIENQQLKIEFTCQNTIVRAEELLLQIGTEGDNLLTLGKSSTPVADAIAVGNSTLLREIKHVAAPRAASDLLNVRTLSLFPERIALIDNLKQSINTIKARLSSLENADADNDGIRNLDDAFPRDPSEFADSDGDGVGDNTDDFVNAITRASDQGLTLASTPAGINSTCSIQSFSAAPVDNQRAPGPSIARQADFLLTGCSPGETVTVSIDFGEAFPPRAAAFKVSAGNWKRINGATINGQTITYMLQDNGPLDLDPAPGVIRDPVSVASAPVEPIPLPAWLLLVLASCLGGLGLRSMHARMGTVPN